MLPFSFQVLHALSLTIWASNQEKKACLIMFSHFHSLYSNLSKHVKKHIKSYLHTHY
uniref:Uncharacterized protein n=1 Tax=Rhizophora mucronata TaxID=61149 RepID=A0A2P2PS36_RHIMU